MKKRSILALLLSLLIVVSLFAGCAPKDKKADTKPVKTADYAAEPGAKLKLWMDNDDYNVKIVEAFNKKYPDIEVTVENVGTIDTRAKLELAGPTGEGADVFVQPHDGVAISAQSALILEQVESTNEIKNNYMGSAVEAVSYNGKVYAFPLTIKTIALFYNKKLVDKPAKTWDEMFKFAKSYNDPSKNKFAMFWQANEPYFAHMALSAKGYEIFGPDHNDKTKLGWTTKEAIEGMKFYKTLKEIYPVPAQDASWDAMNNNFQAGTAPYVITGPWSIKDFTAAGIEFGVTTLPTVGGKHPISLSTVDTACVSSFTKYPKAAKLLAQFMASEEGLKIMYDAKAELPALKSLQDADFIKNDAALTGVLEQAEYSLPMPFIPEMSNVWDPYKKAFTAVWDGISEPEQALKDAQAEFEAAIVKK